ncbi:MAG: sigma 54-interacting transcriptional regulator [Planctomycetes bacterium]|nr:sigma 54-interacting transcriptional regulator [Planctomycetota bacterium]
MKPPALDLTRDLVLLTDLVAAAGDPIEDLLRRGLDALQRLVPYDLATAFLLDGPRLVARVARGRLAGPAVAGHVLRLDEAAPLREALETRRARAFVEEDHAQDGDAWDGVLDLPRGHGCMVVPLCAGDRCLGLITLDRAACVPYAPEAVMLAEVYGQVLALALRGAEERAGLERLHRQDHEHAKALEDRLSGDARPTLEASRSPAMQEVVRRAQQVAVVDTPVLVLGETGTGKERLSRAIHLWSRRADQPFVVVNTAALPGELLESELFGHVKGAFTGATRDRAGRFQVANGGTLLLDEIGELQLDLQAKLLRVLQEGTLQPVGSDRTVRVDVRVLAATHVDLERAVAEGRFRADLYYRLAVFPLRLPPLRERLDDLPGLAAALLAEQAARTGRRGLALSPAALERLRRHAWPGNLRELANVLERAAIVAPGPTLGPRDLDLPDGERRPARATPALDDARVPTLEEIEREHIARVLARTGGKLYGADGAAALLGLKPSTLQSRMKKLGLARRP